MWKLIVLPLGKAIPIDVPFKFISKMGVIPKGIRSLKFVFG
jgi:hypothetical protein